MPIAAIAAIGAVGSIAGGVAANKGAHAQADASLQASQMGVAENQRQYNQNRADALPYMIAGNDSLKQLLFQLGIATPDQIPGVSPAVSSGSTTKVYQATPGGNRYSPGFTRLANDGDGIMHAKLDARQAAADVATARNAPHDIMLKPGESMLNGHVLPAGYDPSGFGSLNKDFTPDDLENEPGYQFQLAEGQKAIERGAASRGTTFSGATQKALNRYATDYAGTKYGEAFNRYNINRDSRYNRYATIAGLGQQSTGQVASNGTQLAVANSGLISNGIIGAGNARASGYAATGQAIQGGLNNISQLLLLKQAGLI